MYTARNRIINSFLLIVCITLGVNLIRSWVMLSDRGNILETTQKQRDEASRTHEKLVYTLAQVQSSQYLDQQARQKLNTSKKGEIIILMPSITPVAVPSPIPEDTREPWRRWVDLFL
jgi:cell division protein FtsB